MLCLVPASAVVPQLDPVVPAPQPYLDVIEIYRRGNYDAAVSTLRSWTEKETQKAVVALMTRRTPALQLPDAPGMFAAAMLHTDAAFASVEALRSAEGSFHLRAAADLLIWTVLNVPDERRWLFSRRDWRLMVTRVLNYDFEWNVYQSLNPPPTVPPRPGPPLGWAPTEMWIARANEIIEDDADMELAVGSLAEGFAFMNAQELKIAQDRKQRALVLQLRQRAESHFRRALGLRPDLVEARLRLGRVLFDEGRTAEAEVELRVVLKATTDARTGHLTLLFLGEVAEKDRRFEEATQLYRRAVDIKPRCQAARIAFAYASERMGDLDRARSVVASFLGRTQARSLPIDDFASYPGGQYQEGYEALARLRARVVRK
jgi:tetratricopeptide (TPR) repeat protein